mgnify:FL=1
MKDLDIHIFQGITLQEPNVSWEYLSDGKKGGGGT